MSGPIPTLFAYDATSEWEHLLPTDVLAAGYDTGFGPNIKWTAAQFDRHMLPYPAIHYDQDPGASDYLSDLLDVEAGAATNAEILRWLGNARTNFWEASRPGQRWPGIYCSLSNVASAVAILHEAGIVNVPFVVADYSVSEAEATRRVSGAIGPYPAVGYQFTDLEFGGRADGNIFSIPWVTTVSIIPLPPPEALPMVILSTVRLNGQTITYTFDGTTAQHIVSPEDQAAYAAVLPIVRVTREQMAQYGVIVP